MVVDLSLARYCVMSATKACACLHVPAEVATGDLPAVVLRGVLPVRALRLHIDHLHHDHVGHKVEEHEGSDEDEEDWEEHESGRVVHQRPVDFR